jgi:cyanophycinase
VASKVPDLPGALLLLALLSGFLPGRTLGQTSCVRPCIGPGNGTLMLAGGGELRADIFGRFLELAGGPDAHIVVIPTAAADEAFPAEWEALAPLRAIGAKHVSVLHTRDRRVADSSEFVEPLRSATGVWIQGGRQGRLVDAYLGTLTQRELARVLERGGVVGGSSAGASIMASYLVRGGVETNAILMAPGYEEGFGFLRNTAVDQHVIVRNRITDLTLVLEAHPELLGIGLDEGTALVVRGDLAEVIGRSIVTVYDDTEHPNTFTWLVPGNVYDLGDRELERRAYDLELQLLRRD